MSLTSPGLWSSMWTAKRFEPVKRRCGGGRPRWVGHRFPIKGGISLADTMNLDFLESALRPSFFERLLAAKPRADSPIVRVEHL